MKGAIMNNKRIRIYYLLCLAGIILASLYPLYMGIKILVDYVQFGYVLGENYPKYLIPYTPVSLALVTCVALLPIALQFKKWGQAGLTAIGFSLFLVFELLLEGMVIRNEISQRVPLQDWQLYMCAIAPATFDQAYIYSVIGHYSPTFKLHFYAISMLIILTVINCFYGFGKQIQTGDRSRQKALILQSIGSALFLGLCILACFTAFFRTGDIMVSPLSAFLMALFFIVFGVIAGIFMLSFIVNKGRGLAWLPGIIACAMALLMYIGEMCLLSGSLYRFGTGWFFDGLGKLVLAPVDILIILASGLITALIAILTAKNKGL